MRDEKQLLLNEIKDKIEGSTSMIVTRYEKLPPNGSWVLRSRLAKNGSLFEVVRKRVFLKAAENSGVQFDESLLGGHIGIVFINQEDALAPAKALVTFSEENGQLLEVLCGKIEGKVVPGAEIVVLSKLPSFNEMRAQLIGLFVAPMSLTLSVMEAAMAGPLKETEQTT